jgi:nitrite reductase/ring-hydroxylating ferredoxin subunit
MGFRERIKRRIDRAGGPSGLVKGALKRGKRPTADRTGEDALSSYTQATAALPEAPDSEGFVAVAASSLIQVGRSSTFAAHGRNIAVYRDQGNLFAIDAACTHEDGPLGESEVVDGVITCPYHDWRFELSSGKCLSEPKRPVATYGIKEIDGLIWVGAAISKGSSDRGGEHDDGLEMR